MSVWKGKIYGPIKSIGTWRIRTNRELHELYKEYDIIRHMESRRIEWVGHFSRMKTARIPKVILTSKLDSKRRIGRPKTKWITDQVEKNRI